MYIETENGLEETLFLFDREVGSGRRMEGRVEESGHTRLKNP